MATPNSDEKRNSGRVVRINVPQIHNNSGAAASAYYEPPFEEDATRVSEAVSAFTIRDLYRPGFGFSSSSPIHFADDDPIKPWRKLLNLIDQISKHDKIEVYRDEIYQLFSLLENRKTKELLKRIKQFRSQHTELDLQDITRADVKRSIRRR